MKGSKRLFAILLILALALTACSSKPTAVPTAAGAPVESSNPEIMIKGFAFNPPDLTVKVGTTVKWTNQDGAVHTVTSDTGVFDSGSLAQGATFSYTFTTAGTFPYHCTPHSGSMSATITVTE